MWKKIRILQFESSSHKNAHFVSLLMCARLCIHMSHIFFPCDHSHPRTLTICTITFLLFVLLSEPAQHENTLNKTWNQHANLVCLVPKVWNGTRACLPARHSDSPSCIINVDIVILVTANVIINTYARGAQFDCMLAKTYRDDGRFSHAHSVKLYLIFCWHGTYGSNITTISWHATYVILS